MKSSINTANTGGLLGALSDKEKKNLLNDLNAPDLQLLLQRQKKLFEIIQKEKDDMPREDLIGLLSRLFEHSSEEGLKFAEQCKITQNEYAEIIKNDMFVFKHPETANHLMEIIGDKYDKIHPDKLDIADNILGDCGPAIAEINNDNLGLFSGNKISLSSPIASKFLNEMDDIYSQYLRIRKFKAENPNDSRTAGERMAEGLFDEVQHAGKQYKTRIVEAIYDTIVKDIYPAKDTFYSNKEKQVIKFLSNIGVLKLAAKIQSDEFIEQQVLNDIINAIKANAANLKYDEKRSAENIQKNLKDAIYKPLGMTFHMQNYLAEKQNKAELEHSLKSHFGTEWEESVKLVYDEKEAIYKVEQEEILGEEEDKLVLEKTIDTNTFKQRGINQIGAPKLIDGSLYFKTKYGKKYGIMDDNFFTRDLYDEIGDFIDVGGRLFYTAKQKGIWCVVDEYGNKTTYPPGVVIQDIIAHKDQRVIKLKNGDQESIDYQNGKTREPAGYIKSINIVDDTLTFISRTHSTSSNYLNKEISSGGLLTKMGPFDRINYQSDRDTPYLRIAEKGKQRYGIDKDRNTVAGDIMDLHGHKKEKKFEKTQAWTTTKKWYIQNKKHKKISEEFDEIYGPREQNGQTIFIGEKGKERQKRSITTTKKGTTTIPSNQKIWKEKDIDLNVFALFGDPVNIDDKIVYSTRLGNKWFIVDDTGKKLSSDYDGIGTPVKIDGKIVFPARLGKKTFITDETGKKLSSDYDRIGTPVKIDGKIVFPARLGKKTFITDETGKKLSSDYIWVGTPVKIDGKIVFAVELGKKTFITDETGKKLSSDYDGIGTPVKINGKITFVASTSSGGKFFITDETGKKISSDYEDIGTPVSINGKIIFAAVIGNKYFIVDETGKKISDEFDEIYGPREYNKQGMFFGKRNGKLEKWIFDLDKGEAQLTDEDQKKLDLLNLCVPLDQQKGDLTNYKQKIEKYLTQESKIKEERSTSGFDKIRNEIKKSAGVLSFLNKTIKQLPQLFINTISAKKDKNEKMLAEEICRRIFPEAFVEEKQTGNSWWRGESNRDEGGFQEPEPEDYLTDQQSYGMEGGDPKTEAKEILQIRGEIHDIITRGIYGSCDEHGMRTKIDFPIDVSISGPQTTTTITIPHFRYHTSLALPKPINANILAERVKGITKDGKEIDLPIFTNALNESSVIVEDKTIKEIMYSIEEPVLTPKLPNISNRDYDTFKKRFIGMQGPAQHKSTPLLDSIAQIDEEELLFLDNIQNDTPKQKLIKIENYVRQHTYYDMDNKEVKGIKRGKSLDEKFFICQKRIDELQDQNPELATALADKKRAGVCSDFALITAAMLRKAGFLSGVIAGFLPSGSTVTTNDAHGVAYAILPDEHGKNQLIIVDGTPHDSGYETLSLEAKEIIREEQEENLEKEMEAMFQQIEETLERGDKDEIDKLLAELHNGNLEDLLNITLKKEVHILHYLHLQNLLNVYRYSPLKDTDISLPANQKFIQQQMQREDATITKDHKQEAKAGTLLFDMTRQFIDKFTKVSGERYQAFDRLESIIDACKDLLHATEYKSIKLIIKYLRAEKIKGK